jgi:eukaryotic-like serine/threonine-protein kinase
MANSPVRAVVDVGSVIADTYTLEALLGRGGMGSVFLASHKRLAGKHVAIKILHTEIEDTDVVARFKREAEIAAKLNHPNIVGVIDYNVAPDGMPYLVLDYLEGETLAQHIARGPLPLDQVLSILRQIGSALAAAHRAGIVHRDLKPQNIFLVPTEVDGRVVEIAKVLDFGISKIRGSQTVQTQDSTLLGTPQYMAPEQAMGQHANVDERTDVFALGAIVYEMLSGQPAFSGASIPEVVFKVVYEQPAPLAALAPTAPAAIVAAVAQAMAKPSEDRFQTVAAFVEAVTGQPLTVTRSQIPGAVAAAESPSGSRRVATREAFAQTMGSAAGDVGIPVNPLLATMAPVTGAPSSQIARGTANARSAAGAAMAAGTTGPSSASANLGSAAIPASPTVDLRSGAGAAARHRPSTGMIAAIALAAAAVAAGAVYLATRSPAPPASQAQIAPPPARDVAGAPPVTPHASATDSRATDSRATDSRVTDSRATDSKTTDSRATDSSATDSSATDPRATDSRATDPRAGKPAVRSDLKAHDPKPATHDARQPAPPENEGDDDTRDKIAQANAALDRNEYDLAERIANAVINSASAGPRQHAAARLIHGTVQCAARNDQEAAQIDLRNLQGFPALRARLINVCRKHGVITAP